MKTENKMSELKIAVAATRDSRSVAFEVFLAADSDFYAALKAFNTAHDSAEKSAKTANDYEAGDYGCYADEDK